MNFVRVGKSGLQISEITLGSALTIGTEHNDESYVQEIIDTAWECGIRSFDTSNNYGMGKAEKLLGKALEKYPRYEYVISTKGSWPVGSTVYERGLSRKHILWAIDESLKHLNYEYVDVYYAHRFDPHVDMAEIVRTFNVLINSGKIRYWATSEWPVEALEECYKVCDDLQMERPIAEQFIYSYAVNKADYNGVKNFCVNEQVGMLGFSPLCQGWLTGKYRGGIPMGSRIAKKKILNYEKTQNFYEQNKGRIDRFLCVADKYGVIPAAVALQWCLRRNVYPVMGASTAEQICENVALLKCKLPQELWEEL